MAKSFKSKNSVKGKGMKKSETTHKKNEGGSGPARKDIECEACGGIFTSESACLTHLAKDHSKKFKCGTQWQTVCAVCDTNCNPVFLRSHQKSHMHVAIQHVYTGEKVHCPSHSKAKQKAETHQACQGSIVSTRTKDTQNINDAKSAGIRSSECASTSKSTPQSTVMKTCPDKVAKHNVKSKHSISSKGDAEYCALSKRNQKNQKTIAKKFKKSETETVQCDTALEEATKRPKTLLDQNISGVANFGSLPGLFRCQWCRSSFAKQTQLKAHVREGHREHSITEGKKAGRPKKCEEKTFSCNWCNAVFRCAEHLQSHSQMHSKPFKNVRTKDCPVSASLGRMPFKCARCVKTFLDGASYEEHLDECPQRIISEGFCCNVCKSVFDLNDKLRTHICTGPSTLSSQSRGGRESSPEVSDQICPGSLPVVGSSPGSADDSSSSKSSHEDLSSSPRSQSPILQTCTSSAGPPRSQSLDDIVEKKKTCSIPTLKPADLNVFSPQFNSQDLSVIPSSKLKVTERTQETTSDDSCNISRVQELPSKSAILVAAEKAPPAMDAVDQISDTIRSESSKGPSLDAASVPQMYSVRSQQLSPSVNPLCQQTDVHLSQSSPTDKHDIVSLSQPNSQIGYYVKQVSNVTHMFKSKSKEHSPHHRSSECPELVSSLTPTSPSITQRRTCDVDSSHVIQSEPVGSRFRDSLSGEGAQITSPPRVGVFQAFCDEAANKLLMSKPLSSCDNKCLAKPLCHCSSKSVMYQRNQACSPSSQSKLYSAVTKSPVPSKGFQSLDKQSHHPGLGDQVQGTERHLPHFVERNLALGGVCSAVPSCSPHRKNPEHCRVPASPKSSAGSGGLGQLTSSTCMISQTLSHSPCSRTNTNRSRCAGDTDQASKGPSQSVAVNYTVSNVDLHTPPRSLLIQNPIYGMENESLLAVDDIKQEEDPGAVKLESESIPTCSDIKEEEDEKPTQYCKCEDCGGYYNIQDPHRMESHSDISQSKILGTLVQLPEVKEEEDAVVDSSSSRSPTVPVSSQHNPIPPSPSVAHILPPLPAHVSPLLAQRDEILRRCREVLNKHRGLQDKGAKEPCVSSTTVGGSSEKSSLSSTGAAISDRQEKLSSQRSALSVPNPSPTQATCLHQRDQENREPADGPQGCSDVSPRSLQFNTTKLTCNMNHSSGAEQQDESRVAPATSGSDCGQVSSAPLSSMVSITQKKLSTAQCSSANIQPADYTSAVEFDSIPDDSSSEDESTPKSSFQETLIKLTEIVTAVKTKSGQIPSKSPVLPCSEPKPADSMRPQRQDPFNPPLGNLQQEYSKPCKVTSLPTSLYQKYLLANAGLATSVPVQASLQSIPKETDMKKPTNLTTEYNSAPVNSFLNTLGRFSLKSLTDIPPGSAARRLFSENESSDESEEDKDETAKPGELSKNTQLNLPERDHGENVGSAQKLNPGDLQSFGVSDGNTTENQTNTKGSAVTSKPDFRTNTSHAGCGSKNTGPQDMDLSGENVVNTSNEDLHDIPETDVGRQTEEEDIVFVGESTNIPVSSLMMQHFPAVVNPGMLGTIRYSRIVHKDVAFGKHRRHRQYTSNDSTSRTPVSPLVSKDLRSKQSNLPTQPASFDYLNYVWKPSSGDCSPICRPRAMRSISVSSGETPEYMRDDLSPPLSTVSSQASVFSFSKPDRTLLAGVHAGPRYSSSSPQGGSYNVKPCIKLDIRSGTEKRWIDQSGAKLISPEVCVAESQYNKEDYNEVHPSSVANRAENQNLEDSADVKVELIDLTDSYGREVPSNRHMTNVGTSTEEPGTAQTHSEEDCIRRDACTQTGLEKKLSPNKKSTKKEQFAPVPSSRLLRSHLGTRHANLKGKILPNVVKRVSHLKSNWKKKLPSGARRGPLYQGKMLRGRVVNIQSTPLRNNKSKRQRVAQENVPQKMSTKAATGKISCKSTKLMKTEKMGESSQKTSTGPPCEKKCRNPGKEALKENDTGYNGQTIEESCDKPVDISGRIKSPKRNRQYNIETTTDMSTSANITMKLRNRKRHSGDTMKTSRQLRTEETKTELCKSRQKLAKKNHDEIQTSEKRMTRRKTQREIKSKPCHGCGNLLDKTTNKIPKMCIKSSQLRKGCKNQEFDGKKVTSKNKDMERNATHLMINNLTQGSPIEETKDDSVSMAGSSASENNNRNHQEVCSTKPFTSDVEEITVVVDVHREDSMSPFTITGDIHVCSDNNAATKESQSTSGSREESSMTCSGISAVSTASGKYDEAELHSVISVEDDCDDDGDDDCGIIVEEERLLEAHTQVPSGATNMLPCNKDESVNNNATKLLPRQQCSTVSDPCGEECTLQSNNGTSGNDLQKPSDVLCTVGNLDLSKSKVLNPSDGASNAEDDRRNEEKYDSAPMCKTSGVLLPDDVTVDDRADKSSTKTKTVKDNLKGSNAGITEESISGDKETVEQNVERVKRVKNNLRGSNAGITEEIISGDKETIEQNFERVVVQGSVETNKATSMEVTLSSTDGQDEEPTHVYMIATDEQGGDEVQVFYDPSDMPSTFTSEWALAPVGSAHVISHGQSFLLLPGDGHIIPLAVDCYEPETSVQPNILGRKRKRKAAPMELDGNTQQMKQPRQENEPRKKKAPRTIRAILEDLDAEKAAAGKSSMKETTAGCEPESKPSSANKGNNPQTVLKEPSSRYPTLAKMIQSPVKSLIDEGGVLNFEGVMFNPWKAIGSKPPAPLTTAASYCKNAPAAEVCVTETAVEDSQASPKASSSTVDKEASQWKSGTAKISDEPPLLLPEPAVWKAKEKNLLKDCTETNAQTDNSTEPCNKKALTTTTQPVAETLSVEEDMGPPCLDLMVIDGDGLEPAVSESQNEITTTVTPPPDRLSSWEDYEDEFGKESCVVSGQSNDTSSVGQDSAVYYDPVSSVRTRYGADEEFLDTAEMPILTAESDPHMQSAIIENSRSGSLDGEDLEFTSDLGYSGEANPTVDNPQRTQSPSFTREEDELGVLAESDFPIIDSCSGVETLRVLNTPAEEVPPSDNVDTPVRTDSDKENAVVNEQVPHCKEEVQAECANDGTCVSRPGQMEKNTKDPVEDVVPVLMPGVSATCESTDVADSIDANNGTPHSSSGEAPDGYSVSEIKSGKSPCITRADNTHCVDVKGNAYTTSSSIQVSDISESEHMAVASRIGNKPNSLHDESLTGNESNSPKPPPDCQQMIVNAEVEFSVNVSCTASPSVGPVVDSEKSNSCLIKKSLNESVELHPVSKVSPESLEKPDIIVESTIAYEGNEQEKEGCDMQTTHGLTNPFKCGVCNETFAELNSYKVHLKKHIPERKEISQFTCKDCGGLFSSAAEVESHMILHYQQPGFKCSDCEAMFGSMSSLKEHKNTHVKLHRCYICEKAFNKPYQLNLHMATHLGRKTYECPMCRASFARPSRLESHMMIHFREKPHQCPYCPAAFARITRFEKHMKIHEMLEGKVQLHKCDICEVEYSQLTGLQKHMKIHKQSCDS